MINEKNTGTYEPLRDFEQKVVHILLYNTETATHFHGSIEILHVKKGKVEYCTNLQRHILSEGEIIFIPPFFTHSFHSLTESETETIIIPSTYLKDYNTYFSGLYFPTFTNKKINAKIEIIFQEFERMSKSSTCNELMIKGLINYFLGYIATNYPSFKYRNEDALMIEIALYINKNFKSKISLESIASHFNYNKTYFSRLFKKYFNCSFPDFVNNMRYNYILENSKNGNITNLIHEVGFSSTSSFYRYRQRNKTTNKNDPTK